MPFSDELIRSLMRKILRKDELVWEDKNSVAFRVSEEVGQDILVKEGERVALYGAGSFHTILGSGSHEIESEVDELVFLDVSQQKEKFGIARPRYPITRDQLSLGFSGNLVFNIMEDRVSVGNFVEKILGEKGSITSSEIVTWLCDGLLFQILREIISGYTYAEFLNLDRRDLHIAIETKLGLDLSGYGLEVNSVEILYFTPPLRF